MDELLNKLYRLRQKYYQRALLKGLLWSLGALIMLALALALLEFFTFLAKDLRLLLFWAYLSFFVLSFIRWVVIPLGRMYGFFKPITYQELAHLVGKEFPAAEDRILGALHFGQGLGQDALVQAALEQYWEKLRPVPFQQVIHWREAWRFWPLAVVPLILAMSLFLTEGGRKILEGGSRIVRYSEDFKPEAPFDFLLLNDSLSVVQGDDLRVRLKIQGDRIPREAHLHLGQESLRMIRDSSGYFHLDLNNLQDSQGFFISAASFQSSEYGIDILSKPELRDLSIEIQPPAYTGQGPNVAKYRPRLVVPKGSKIRWQGKLSENSTIYLQTGRKKVYYKGREADTVLDEDFSYRIGVENADIGRLVTGPSKIKIKPDIHPKIEANFQVDSAQGKVLFYKVQYQDDYGISNLALLLRRGDQVREIRSFPTNGSSGELQGSMALDSLGSHKSGLMELFFEVEDNDAIDGPKSSRSKAFAWNRMSKEEEARARRKNLKQAAEGGKEVAAARKKLDQELNEIQQSLMKGKELSWKEQQKIGDLLEKLQELERKSKQRKERLRKDLEKEGAEKDSLNAEEKRLKELSQEEKELEKLKEEIEDLMNDLNKDRLENKLQELQKENKQRLRQEERSQELLEDLMFQRDVLKKAKRLKDLADRQKKLADSSGGKEESQEQNELLEEMKNSLEKIEELGKKDQDLQDELEERDFEESQDSATNAMEDAREQLKKEDSEGANESQDKASEEMEEMGQKLQQSMMNMESESLKINMESLRRILENLEVYSQGVEDAGGKVANLEEGDPAYRRLLKEQERLAKGAEVIEDSLKLLSKKAPQVKEKVFDELDQMKRQLSESKGNLQETETQKAATKLRYSMMAANELALLLEQSMQQMQQMMAMQKKGKQNCQKPGGSKPKPGSASEKLQKLGKKVQKLKQGQKPGEKGQKSPEGKDGKEGKKGSQGKEMARILSEQEQLRRELEEMNKDKGSQGDKGSLDQSVEDMKQMERDLVERDYEAYLERYRRIESRMLENEKAEMQRKQKEERIAEEGSNLRQEQQSSNASQAPRNFTMDEGLMLLPLELKPFYQERSFRE